MSRDAVHKAASAMVRRAAILLAAALLAGGCAARLPVSPARTAEAPPDEQLRLLVEEWFDGMLVLNPVTATFFGEHRYDDRLGDPASPEHEAAMLALDRRYLEAVLAVDPAVLGPRDRLIRDTFVRDRRLAIEESHFPGRLMPISQQTGMALLLPQLGLGIQPLETTRDYQRWMHRLSEFPVWVDSAIAAMREGIARGVTQPRATMERVVPQFDALVAAVPAESPFYEPAERMPDGISAGDQARLRARLTELIEGTLNPAYVRLRDFVRDEYLPAARDSIGWSALPDGVAWYRWLIADNTTTDLTAGEIHSTGLGEVARIRAGMEAVAGQVGFEGDLQAFFAHLRADPRNFFEDPQELIDGYADIRRRVTEALPRLFARLPTADFVIRPVEDYRAEAAAGGSYRAAPEDSASPAVFYVNTFNLKAQPKYGMETLFLHEALPGHHFQISLQRELTSLPRFRRYSGYVAYVEGWAMYSESLGRELGLFSDPMQYYGRLNDEMLRAMRLVVDTGMHAFGWSRNRAIQYMKDNSSMAESDVVAEVERYIAWPGQALGYKIGDLRIQAMRRRAEAALGERFDIRAFHALVLEDGALPLDVLDARIDRWIAEAQATGR